MKVSLACSDNQDYWDSLLEEYRRFFKDVERFEGTITSDKQLSMHTMMIMDGLENKKLRQTLDILSRPYILVCDDGIEFSKINEKSSAISFINKTWSKTAIAKQLACAVGEFLKIKLEQEMDQLSEDLARVLGTSLSDYHLIKKLHEKFVPLRVEELKGVKFVSKYAAGQRVGGEFFDIMKLDSEVLIIMSSTKSYIASSVVLSHFEKIKTTEDVSKDSIKRFLTDLSSDCKNLSLLDDGGNSGIELLVLVVNINNLNVWGYGFGNSRILSTKKVAHLGNEFPLSSSFFDKAEIEFSLDRDENLCLLSPGLIKNIPKYKDDPKDIKRLKEMIAKDPASFLNELFYEIKKDVVGDFLEDDALAMHIKVDKNVLVEI